LDNTITCLLTNIYGTSSTGIAFWLTGSDSRENRISTATFKDSAVGVEDDTNNTQYFTGVIAENNSQRNWTTHQNDHLVNCNIIPEFPSFLILPLFMIATLLAVIVYRRKHAASARATLLAVITYRRKHCWFLSKSIKKGDVVGDISICRAF
jgi:hypothetical protein